MEMAGSEPTQLNLGISTFYSKYYLPRILPVVKHELPNVKLNVIEDISQNLEDMVLGNVLDFCMVPTPLEHRELMTTPLVVERILLAFPPDHALLKKYPESESVPLHEVRNEPFVFLRQRQRFTKMGMDMCEEAGFRPKIVYETMSWDTVDAIIAKGVGVGFVPELVVNIPSETKPHYRRISSCNDSRDYMLAYMSDQLKRKTGKEFIALIERTMR